VAIEFLRLDIGSPFWVYRAAMVSRPIVRAIADHTRFVYGGNGSVELDEARKKRDRYSEGARIVAWKMPYSSKAML
jgi:hypothetical protein